MYLRRNLSSNWALFSALTDPRTVPLVYEEQSLQSVSFIYPYKSHSDYATIFNFSFLFFSPNKCDYINEHIALISYTSRTCMVYYGHNILMLEVPSTCLIFCAVHHSRSCRRWPFDDLLSTLPPYTSSYTMYVRHFSIKYISKYNVEHTKWSHFSGPIAKKPASVPFQLSDAKHLIATTHSILWAIFSKDDYRIADSHDKADAYPKSAS